MYQGNPRSAPCATHPGEPAPGPCGLPVMTKGAPPTQARGYDPKGHGKVSRCFSDRAMAPCRSKAARATKEWSMRVMLQPRRVMKLTEAARARSSRPALMAKQAGSRGRRSAGGG